MKRTGMTSIQRGQAITFRLPSDTPDYIINQLQKLKETERRNFSSKMAAYILAGVKNSLLKEKETITIPLPKQLSKEQRNWLKHSHSEALLGSIVYQLLADPIRAASVLASLNSNALDINNALYLQEDARQKSANRIQPDNKKRVDQTQEMQLNHEGEELEDDLMSFDWEQAKQEHVSAMETSQSIENEDVEELLGGFLAQMNK